MKKCPYCAEEIQDEAIVCKHCSRPLPGHNDNVPDQVKPHRSPVLYFALTGIVVLLVVLGSFTTDPPLYTRLLPPTPTPICAVQAQSFIAKTERLFDDWDDANAVAGSTGRIALSPAIAELQRIRRDVVDVQVPPCAKAVQDSIVTYMDKTIEGYLLFMADEPEDKVNNTFEFANKLMDISINKFVNLKAQLITTAEP